MDTTKVTKNPYMDLHRVSNFFNNFRYISSPTSLPTSSSEPMSGPAVIAIQTYLAARLGDKQEELVTNLKIVTFC